MNEEYKALYNKCQNDIDIYIDLALMLLKRKRGLCNYKQRAMYTIDIGLAESYIAILKLLMASISENDTVGIEYCRASIISGKALVKDLCDRYHLLTENQVLTENHLAFCGDGLHKLRLAIKFMPLGTYGYMTRKLVSNNQTHPLQPSYIDYKEDDTSSDIYHQQRLSCYRCIKINKEH